MHLLTRFLLKLLKTFLADKMSTFPLCCSGCIDIPRVLDMQRTCQYANNVAITSDSNNNCLDGEYKYKYKVSTEYVNINIKNVI